MIMHACRLLCLLLSVLPACVSAEAPQLVIGISNALSEPRLIRHDAAVSGIVPEIAHALGGAVQRPVELLLLPRKRLPVALQNGEIDGICLTSPNRLDLPQVELRWTPVVFEDLEVVVGHPSSQPIRKVEDLYGKMIGTPLGYHYPLLEDDFHSGRILRNDAPDEALNLRKLLMGRFSYIIWKDDAARWYNKNGTAGTGLQISPLLIERTSLHCAFSPRSGLSETALAQAVRQLESDGTLRAIPQRYR